MKEQFKTTVHVSDIEGKSKAKEFNDITIFETNVELRVNIKKILIDLNRILNKDVIKLIAIEFYNEIDQHSPIFVSKYDNDIFCFLSNYIDYNRDNKGLVCDSDVLRVSDIYIFSYDNYQEAYEDALMMREGIEYCYKN